jgi:hypothetical protein
VAIHKILVTASFVFGQLHDANDFDEEYPSQECSALRGEHKVVLARGHDATIGEQHDAEEVDHGHEGAQGFD